MKKKSLNRLSAFFNILLVVFLLLPNFLVSASVFAANPVPSLPISGIVGSTTADPSATFASSYLRYVGNPAPSGFSHAYQWEDPYYVCDPNSNPVVFNGTINTLSMIQGGVAFVGLIDKGLLESDKTGYQSGAYAYIYKNSPSTLIIGPTDGNIGDGEIVQVFKSYPIPVDGIINLQITIYNGRVALQVNGDTVLSDDYGFVKTLNNSNVYSWNEFEFKAVPGWDNYETGSVPYNFSLTGCQEILPPDTTAPVVILTAPSDNYFTKLTSVLQTWESDDTDIDYYEYESCSNDPDVDGFCTRIYSVITDNTSRTVNNNNIAFWWRVRAVDLTENVGNWTEARKITIDTLAPIAPQIVSPTPEQYFRSTPILNDWTDVLDLSGIKEYRIEYIYDDLHTFSGAPYRLTTLSNRNHVPGLWEQGGVTIRVQAFDNAGNEGEWSQPVHYFYDATAPVGQITGIRYPKADSTNFITNLNTPLIYGTYGDNLEVDKVEVKIGEVEGAVILDNGNWTAQFPIIPEGIQTISLKITDKAGNITEVAKEITIDSVAPSAVYTHYIKGELFEGEIAEVKSLSDLSFTGEYKDPNPSSELKYDSFVIFQAQDDGSFRFAANGKQSYCSWRTSPNLVDLSGSTYNLTDQIPFTNCIASLPDGEYYMSHQVFDNAVRNDIPTISQFRDVLGLHFKINNTPVVTITIPFTEVVQGTASFTVQADAIDGNAPLEYEWTASNGFTSTEKSFTFMPVLVGVYTYTVKVTDADGDMDQKSVTITVKAPTIEQPQDIQAVLGTTNTTMTPVVTKRPLVVASVFETTPEVVEEEISVLPEILGEEDISCVAKAVSGHVYLDKNENNAWDKDDKAFSNIKINITTKDENDEKIVEEFTTNEEGEWKTTLCAGKYLVSIDTTSIPENYKLNGDSTIQIDVLEGDTKGVEQSFLLTESKTFLQKYWWILLLAILVVTSIVIAGSKKDEKQSS